LRLHASLRRRPSPAIIISSIALFMSLGGVGYAATELPNNSVGNSQIRNGAVSYRKIRPGSVGTVRANTNQLQVRVSGSCAANNAIASVNSIGKVSCNPTLPAEFGTTNNTASVPTGATTPTTISSVALNAGTTYLAFANPTITVTPTATAQHVTVSCTLTVGSNTQTRSGSVDAPGTGSALVFSIPLQVAGPSGTGSVACQSATSDTTAATAAAVSVTSAVNALQTASNS
jgi:hypothetical protein